MRTIITGLPYFSKHIQSKLKDHYRNDKFFLLNTYYSFWDKILFLILLPFTDVVYSINGATHGSKVFDLAIRFRKRIIFHWVGSDVLQAKQDFEENRIVRNYIEKVNHIACAPWLAEELAALNIRAGYIPLYTFSEDIEKGIVLPEHFSILTYIPQNKEKFYGIDHIIHLAERFPDVEIRIAGLTSPSQELPGNITLLGWIENMAEEIQHNTVCVRIPIHDGLSFFVVESLVNQRFVICNHNFEPCIYANDDQSLQEQILKLKSRFDRGELMTNEEGRKYIIRNFGETEVVEKIYAVLKG